MRSNHDTASSEWKEVADPPQVEAEKGSGHRRHVSIGVVTALFAVIALIGPVGAHAYKFPDWQSGSSYFTNGSCEPWAQSFTTGANASNNHAYAQTSQISGSSCSEVGAQVKAKSVALHDANGNHYYWTGSWVYCGGACSAAILANDYLYSGKTPVWTGHYGKSGAAGMRKYHYN